MSDHGARESSRRGPVSSRTLSLPESSREGECSAVPGTIPCPQNTEFLLLKPGVQAALGRVSDGGGQVSISASGEAVNQLWAVGPHRMNQAIRELLSPKQTPRLPCAQSPRMCCHPEQVLKPQPESSAILPLLFPLGLSLQTDTAMPTPSILNKHHLSRWLLTVGPLWAMQGEKQTTRPGKNGKL